MAANDNTALLLQMSADLSQLKKKYAQDGIAIVNSGSDAMERRAKKAAQNIEGAFGKINVGKALTKVFDSSKLAVLEEGGAKLRVFGSALEPLGPLGLGVAAGLVAVGAALEETHKAVEFADNLFKLAKNAHVTTDELQAFSFALRIAGGNGDEAGAALQSFSTKLGQAQEGLPKAQRAFLALGFSKAQIKSFGDAGEALLAVTARIEQLKSPAQKDAVVTQLGLEQMKPLIEGGVEKMRDFLTEAQKAGVIMDAGLVKRGHELNEQMETLNRKISVELKSAFIELGPLLLEIVTQVAKLAEFAAEAAKSFHDLALNPTTVEQLHLLAEMARGLREGGITGFALAGVRAGIDANAHAEGLRQTAARDRATRATTGATDTAGGAREDDPDFIRRQHGEKLPTGSRTLIDQSKTKAGPRDDSRQRQDAVDAALAQAERGRLQALAALTGDLARRADFELAALDAEASAEKARLQKQIDEVNADKGISGAKKERLTAELEMAKLLVDAASLAKQQKIKQDAAFAIEDTQLGVYKEILEAQIDELQAQVAIAGTADQRKGIEARILALRQQLERDLKGTQLDRDVVTGAKTSAQADAERDALKRRQSAAQSEFDVAHQSPIEAYRRSIKSLNDEFQNAGVTAIDDFANGLGDAIVNARSLGDVASNVFKRLISELIAESSKKLILDILAFIPGFASGTGSAPGGVALVGERGPELVNLPRGTQVIPSDRTLSMIKSMAAPQRNVAVTVIQPFHFHAEGAVMTEELIARANSYADKQSARAYAGARRDGRADSAALQYAGHLNA